MENNSNLTKLIKMKARALEISDDSKEQNLKEYATLAKKISEKDYKTLIDKINNIFHHNYTLEEEYTYLEEIELDYQQFKERYNKFKEIYQKYSITPLELPKIEDINISAIKKRKNIILYYLINQRNIENVNKKIEYYSNSLAEAEQLKIKIAEIISRLEKELLDLFLTSEGRLNENGTSKATSTVAEYKNNGLDINLLIGDKTLLDETIEKVDHQRTEAEENLKAIEICYNNLQNEESQNILQTATKETINLRYKLILLRIASIIASQETDYYKSITKRQNLIDLINYRKNCLRTLGIELLIDPMTRIKIQEQLSKITSYEENSKRISELREKINSASSELEELMYQNKVFKNALSQKMEYIKKAPFIIEQNSSNINNTSRDSKKNDTIPNNVGQPNKVVSISSQTANMNSTIINQKTKNVIKRINELLYPEEKIEKNSINKKEEIEFELTSIKASINPSNQIIIPPPQIVNKNTVEPLFEDMATEPFKKISFFDEKREEETSKPNINFSNKQEKIETKPDESFWPIIDPIKSTIPIAENNSTSFDNQMKVFAELTGEDQKIRSRKVA